MKYKTIIKQIVKPLLPLKIKYYGKGILWMRRHYKKASLVEILSHTKLIIPKANLSIGDNYVRQAEIIFSNIHIDTNSYYIYPYDKWVIRILPKGITNLASITPDYGKILTSNLRDIAKGLVSDKSDFSKNEQRLVLSIIQLSERICKLLRQSDSQRAEVLGTYFEDILFSKPNSLDKAIQKLLFYNGLFWQMWHWHNGLGRLDLVLDEYYRKDVETGVLNRDKAKQLIKELCLALGNNTESKSLSLQGDTGQYILLGGINEKGETVQNELTEIFLEVFAENRIADPKLILRTNADTSDVVWKKAVSSILTGCGSPLLMNEDLIMKGMLEFGYKKDDVWNVGTSACWEPLIIGKSFDQNNSLRNVPIISSLNHYIDRNNRSINFNEFLEDYKLFLKKQILSHVHDINFDISPLFSLFFDDCLKREKDFTQGGAVYAFHGIQIVSFPNFINALLNIKDYVFDNHYFSLEECADALRKNYSGYEDMRDVFTSNNHRFGSTDDSVVNLCNNIIRYISEVVAEMQVNGECVKVGFSSSTYIEQSKNVGASLDGRKYGEPFAVHISPVSQKIDIQEVIKFAGKLDYSGNKINGNVVDFILPTSFAKVPEKLVTMLQYAMSQGVFELQLNVLDAATLKDAKAHPEKYPSLVVRVWGFSAYFNDLPENYKDNLIKRAETYA